MRLVIIQWWDGLTSREQGLLAGATLVVVIGFLYWGIWQPLDSRYRQAEAGVRGQQQLLAWVQQQADTVVSLQASGQRAPGRSTQSLSQIVTSTAGRYDIRPSRMQPQGENLQVWVDSVRFDNLLRWLEQLQQGYGVTVTVADIAREEAAGLVKVRRLELTK